MTDDVEGALAQRGCVISFAAFRAARIAADFMLGTFHDPPWMAGVVVEGDGNGVAGGCTKGSR